MKTKDGFGTIEIVIIVAVVLAVAGLTWYALIRPNENKSDSSGVAQKVSNSPKVTVSPTTSVSATPPADCPKVAQEGVAIFIELKPDSPDLPCMQVSKDAAISITNHTKADVTATIGNKTSMAIPNSSSGFDGEIGKYVGVGRHVLDVSAYDSNKDPVIWVY